MEYWIGYNAFLMCIFKAAGRLNGQFGRGVDGVKFTLLLFC